MGEILEIGQRVRINEGLDDVGMETHGHMIGMVGCIFNIDWNHQCGENDDGIDGDNTDPIYHVGFDNGEWGGFFREELDTYGLEPEFDGLYKPRPKGGFFCIGYEVARVGDAPLSH